MDVWINLWMDGQKDGRIGAYIAWGLEVETPNLWLSFLFKFCNPTGGIVFDVCRHTCHGTQGEVTGQLSGICCLLLLCIPGMELRPSQQALLPLRYLLTQWLSFFTQGHKFLFSAPNKTQCEFSSSGDHDFPLSAQGFLPCLSSASLH